MVDIPIGNYRLQSYEHGWIVGEVKVRGDDSKNAGEEYIADQRYYPNVSAALTALCDRTLRVSDARTLQELQRTVVELRQQFATLFT